MAEPKPTGSSFNVPDFLSFAFPLISYFTLPDYPSPPSLRDIGVSKKDISSFFNLKRALSRLGIQRQGAQAARNISASLPSSLRQSTIPASMQAALQAKIADKIAEAEAGIAGEEMQARFKLYDILQQQWQNQMAIAQQEQQGQTDIFEVLSLLPLFL